MQTPTVLCVLLSLAIGSALAQTPAAKEVWRADPAKQLERDAARKSILETELAAEARQFAEAHAELRDARSRQISGTKLEDIAERVNRHRRNMAALGGEIARDEGHRDVRKSDRWLIPSPAKPVAQEPTKSRPEPMRPAWIIQ